MSDVSRNGISPLALPELTRNNRWLTGSTGGRSVATGRTLALVMAGAAFALPAAAQDVNPLLTFSFSSSLHVTDNYDLSNDPEGTTTYIDNRLGLSYLTETETQRLALDASGVLRVADYPGSGDNSGTQTDFDDHTLRFDYTLTGANSRLNANAYYNRSDIAFFDPFRLVNDGINLDPEDLTVTSGYREVMRGGLRFETGTEGPLSFSAGITGQKRNYLETDDPSLEANESYTVTSGVGMLITPTTRLTLDGLYRDYSAEDAEETDRQTRSLSVGVIQEMASGLTINGSVGYQTIETEENYLDGRRTEDSNGVIGQLGLTQQLTNGTAGLSFSQTRNTSGGRSTLQVSRDMELPDGELAASLGVSRGDQSGRTSMIGSLAYSHALQNGTFRLSLAQQVYSNSDDEEVETRSLNIGLSHELTPVSGIHLNVSYVDIDTLDSGDDRKRGRFQASYNHELTQDWDLSGGYEYTRLERQSGTATENAVFLTIQRQFQFRP